jgi:hypothetical protein
MARAVTRVGIPSRISPFNKQIGGGDTSPTPGAEYVAIQNQNNQQAIDQGNLQTNGSSAPSITAAGGAIIANPQLYQNQSYNITTPSGTVQEQIKPQIINGQVQYRPVITQNQTFTQPINQTSNGFTEQGTITGTYQTSGNGLSLLPVVTSTSGTISYQNQIVGTLGANGSITATNAQIKQPVYGVSSPGQNGPAGQNQLFGTLILTPSVQNGNLTLLPTGFQSANVLFAGHGYYGYINSSYNAQSGQISLNPQNATSITGNVQTFKSAVTGAQTQTVNLPSGFNYTNYIQNIVNAGGVISSSTPITLQGYGAGNLNFNAQTGYSLGSSAATIGGEKYALSLTPPTPPTPLQQYQYQFFTAGPADYAASQSGSPNYLSPYAQNPLTITFTPITGSSSAGYPRGTVFHNITLINGKEITLISEPQGPSFQGGKAGTFFNTKTSAYTTLGTHTLKIFGKTISVNTNPKPTPFNIQSGGAASQTSYSIVNTNPTSNKYLSVFNTATTTGYATGKALYTEAVAPLSQTLLFAGQYAGPVLAFGSQEFSNSKALVASSNLPQPIKAIALGALNVPATATGISNFLVQGAETQEIKVGQYIENSNLSISQKEGVNFILETGTGGFQSFASLINPGTYPATALFFGQALAHPVSTAVGLAENPEESAKLIGAFLILPALGGDTTRAARIREGFTADATKPSETEIVYSITSKGDQNSGAALLIRTSQPKNPLETLFNNENVRFIQTTGRAGNKGVFVSDEAVDQGLKIAIGGSPRNFDYGVSSNLLVKINPGQISDYQLAYSDILKQISLLKAARPEVYGKDVTASELAGGETKENEFYNGISFGNNSFGLLRGGIGDIPKGTTLTYPLELFYGRTEVETEGVGVDIVLSRVKNVQYLKNGAIQTTIGKGEAQGISAPEATKITGGSLRYETTLQYPQGKVSKFFGLEPTSIQVIPEEGFLTSAFKLKPKTFTFFEGKKEVYTGELSIGQSLVKAATVTKTQETADIVPRQEITYQLGGEFKVNGEGTGARVVKPLSSYTDADLNVLVRKVANDMSKNGAKRIGNISFKLPGEGELEEAGVTYIAHGVPARLVFGSELGAKVNAALGLKYNIEINRNLLTQSPPEDIATGKYTIYGQEVLQRTPEENFMEVIVHENVHTVRQDLFTNMRKLIDKQDNLKGIEAEKNSYYIDVAREEAEADTERIARQIFQSKMHFLNDITEPAKVMPLEIVNIKDTEEFHGFTKQYQTTSLSSRSLPEIAGRKGLSTTDISASSKSGLIDVTPIRDEPAGPAHSILSQEYYENSLGAKPKSSIYTGYTYQRGSPTLGHIIYAEEPATIVSKVYGGRGIPAERTTPYPYDPLLQKPKVNTPTKIEAPAENTDKISETGTGQKQAVVQPTKPKVVSITGNPAPLVSIDFRPVNERIVKTLSGKSGNGGISYSKILVGTAVGAGSTQRIGNAFKTNIISSSKTSFKPIQNFKIQNLQNTKSTFKPANAFKPVQNFKVQNLQKTNNLFKPVQNFKVQQTQKTQDLQKTKVTERPIVNPTPTVPNIPPINIPPLTFPGGRRPPKKKVTKEGYGTNLKFAYQPDLASSLLNLRASGQSEQLGLFRPLRKKGKQYGI